MANTKRKPIAQRFWSKVLKTKTCLLWQRQINDRGYGCFAFYATLEDGRRSKNMYAHRVAWLLTNGPVPDGLFVLHKCDTPACVRPDHLFVGNQVDNMADCNRKGRYSCGARHPSARLTEDDVRAIKSELKRDRRTQEQIAARFGIHQMTVSDIKRGKTWKHVD